MIETTQSAEAPAAADVRMPGPILVIDDDEAVGIVLGRALAKLGYTADIAVDGARGVELYRRDPARYSLVLLDFKLPGMDSRTVFGEIRSLRGDIPVVLMSGYNRDEALEKSQGLHLSGFLKKPFTMDALAAALSLANG
jgi:two-component system cell cycle sensor histidine kinase/response regulator CckA